MFMNLSAHTKKWKKLCLYHCCRLQDAVHGNVLTVMAGCAMGDMGDIGSYHDFVTLIILVIKCAYVAFSIAHG